MPTPLLDHIDEPADLKRLSPAQLKQLAEEIRTVLIETTSVTGGHLAPSLGAVELILGIHRAIDAPHDKLVFDVGHQAYAHKLITGRRDAFSTLRSHGGLSGFTRRSESPFDSHDSGHASDSLSTALGLALARDLDGRDETIVALIGDGAISGGLAFEAMNQIGQLHTKMTIVLNDNEMSISKNVGALSLALARARTANAYRVARERMKRHINSKYAFVRAAIRLGLAARDSLKQVLVPGMYFEELGLKYLGPIDGHDIAAVQSAVEMAQRATGPVLIHCITHKGEGYEPAEERPDVFHGIAPFDLETGAVHRKPGQPPAYTKVFSEHLTELAEADENIVAITAAMSAGTGTEDFSHLFPERFFDVGIAEEHAVTLASGLALGGKTPFVAIYSTFLQRAMDETIINVGLQNQHVVFCIDRAGIVGADGATHTGMFDIAYMRMIPNMSILAPSNEAELVRAMNTALVLPGPVAIRYPRGGGPGIETPQDFETFDYGRAVSVREGSDVAILALGRMAQLATHAADLLEEKGISCRIVDMRWAKPIDEEAVRQAAGHSLVVTLEEGILSGGFGQGVLEILSHEGLEVPTLTLGIDDEFVPQGDLESVLSDLGLSPAQVADRIETALDSSK